MAPAGARDNRGVNCTSLILALGMALGTVPSSYGFAKLTPETNTGFERYVQQAEAEMARNQQKAMFLQSDRRPDLKPKLRGGEVMVESAVPEDAPNVSGGMLQDWRGMMFMSGATLEKVKTVLQDYENYKSFYKPKVIDSKRIAQSGDEYDIVLRLYEKHVLTVVLNTTYHVSYRMLDSDRMSVTSRSTRIAEVKDPKQSYTEEEPVGNDTGFLWRLNSYWRFEAADGGVYAECRAISLSRDVPLGLGFMLKRFLEKFPKESMMNTLRGTQTAVANLKGSS